jgi:MFS transporter, DHA2 family, multidrug resistance protein
VIRSMRPGSSAPTMEGMTAALAYERRWKTLRVLALSLVIIGLDNTILNVALPSLQEHFDASSSTLQWMVDSYLVSFAGLLLTMGTLGDRFGRKRALQTGIAIFGLSSLAVLFVETSTQLIAVRALMGVGGALIMPATLSIITNVFPREERAKAIGIWAGTAAIGVGLGPLFGGLLLEYFDWSSVFLVNVPVALVAFLAGMRLVPDSRDPNPGRFDAPGALLSIAALVTLIYAVIEAPERGWLDPAILGAFGGALALGAAFVAWELRTAAPMLDLSLFRNPRFGIGSMSISLAFFSLFGSIFALTQFLQFAKDYSPLEAGAAMVPLAFGLMLGATRSTKLAERLGTTRVVAGGLLGLGAMLATTLLWTSDMPYWPIGLWFFGVALSMGCVMGPATSSVMGAVPKEKSGVASAMNDVTRQVGGALGTAVIGSLVASFYSSRVADAASGLPSGAQDAVKDSIGTADAVAAELPADQGSSLAHSAASAFTDALGLGLCAAAVAALVAAIVVIRRLPARAADEQQGSAPVVVVVQAASAS